MSCEYCRIGHYEDIVTPYIQWLDGHIMVIPNAPAYSCDICGHMEYDPYFMQRLDQLLTHFAEDEPNDVTIRPRPLVANPAFMVAARRSQ